MNESSWASKKSKVLLVENEPDSAAVLEILFKRAGYEVAVAANGVEALAAYWKAESEREPFDLVFTDLAMSPMDGATLASRIRSAEVDMNKERMKIIGYTAHAKLAKDSVAPGDFSNFDAVFRKGANVGRITELVAEVMKGAAPPELTLTEQVADIRRMVVGLEENDRVADAKRECVAEDLAAAHRRADNAPPGEAGTAADAAARLTPKECEE